MVEGYGGLLRHQLSVDEERRIHRPRYAFSVGKEMFAFLPAVDVRSALIPVHDRDSQLALTTRAILWRGQWQRIDAVAAELRQNAPQSFRPLQVYCRNGETKTFWAFTKTVRLRRYGRKRMVIVHERGDLTDATRFLLTDALHWERGRIMETWSFRWTAELFHAFGKQGTGLEAAQVRTEEAVNRHLRFSCVAQSLLQRTPAVASSVETFAFAQGQIAVPQKSPCACRL